MKKEDMAGLRPQVIKHHDLFVKYCRTYGCDTVKETLIKGHSGAHKLKIMGNKKDRYQMLQLLGL